MEVLLCQSPCSGHQETSSHSIYIYFFLLLLLLLLYLFLLFMLWSDRFRHVRAQLSMNLIPQMERVCHFPPTTLQKHNGKSYFLYFFVFFFFFKMLENALHSFSMILFFCFSLQCSYTCSRKNTRRRKRAKVPKCAAARRKKEGTSL